MSAVVARRSSGFLFCLAMLLGAGCSAEPTLTHKMPSEQLKVRLGNDLTTILSTATKCEVFLIDRARGPNRKPASPQEKAIGGYRITAVGGEQNRLFTQKLVDVLFTNETYDYPQPTKCFEPGVAFRLWEGPRAIEVLVCFACDNLLLQALGTDGERLQDVFGNYNQLSRTQLVRLVKEAFPHDPNIQAIPEESRKFGGARNGVGSRFP